MTNSLPARVDLQHVLDRIPDQWGKYLDVRPGWYQLVLDLDRDLAAVAPNYELHQVKQKFGGLRYYVGEIQEGAWDRVAEIVRTAEDRSLRTCEECGIEDETVATGGRSWIETLCAAHRSTGE